MFRVFKVFIFIVLAGGTRSVLAGGFQKDDLRTIRSPFVKNDTLYIEGPIGSHIYDYLAYLRQKVTKISLKSYGGDHYWALEIAKKIQSLNITVEIPENGFCASACVYLFGAGSQRVMHKSSWIGIHGARLAGSYVILFDEKCRLEKENRFQFMSPNCDEFLKKSIKLSLEKTLDAFSLIEESGVSPRLKEYYFSLNDMENWYVYYNVLKKPDWALTPQVALGFNLATEVVGETP